MPATTLSALIPVESIFSSLLCGRWAFCCTPTWRYQWSNWWLQYQPRAAPHFWHRSRRLSNTSRAQRKLRLFMWMLCKLDRPIDQLLTTFRLIPQQKLWSHEIAIHENYDSHRRTIPPQLPTNQISAKIDRERIQKLSRTQTWGILNAPRSQNHRSGYRLGPNSTRVRTWGDDARWASSIRPMAVDARKSSSSSKLLQTELGPHALRLGRTIGFMIHRMPTTAGTGTSPKFITMDDTGRRRPVSPGPGIDEAEGWASRGQSLPQMKLKESQRMVLERMFAGGVCHSPVRIA